MGDFITAELYPIDGKAVAIATHGIVRVEVGSSYQQSRSFEGFAVEISASGQNVVKDSGVRLRYFGIKSCGWLSVPNLGDRKHLFNSIFRVKNLCAA
jgi:hypothetical protein